MKTQYKEGDIVLLNRSPYGSYGKWDKTTTLTLGRADIRGSFDNCKLEGYIAGLAIPPHWIAGYAPVYDPGHAPDTTEVISYFKSPGGGLLIKTAGEDKEELELDTNNGELKFDSDSLGYQYYLGEGYTPIDREEFDAAYVAIIKNLNKFASL